MNIAENIDSAISFPCKEYYCAIPWDNSEHHASVETTDDDNRFVITISARRLDVEVLHHDGAQMVLLINKTKYVLLIRVGNGQIEVLHRGISKKIRIGNQYEHLLGASVISNNSDSLKAPMPGIVNNILVTIGQKVHEGDEIVHLESMKMINALTASRDGVVENIHVEKGQTVRLNQLVVELQPRHN